MFRGRPELLGPTITRNEGIVGGRVDLTLRHTEETRAPAVLFALTKHLVYTRCRDAGGAPKLHLFGQLKRIARKWMEHHLVCRGGTYPAQLLHHELAEMACDRISTAITAAYVGERPVQAELDPYNPVGSTMHVRFSTSRERWTTRADRSHVNWVVLDSDWETELCRAVESHPRVRAYAKNHNLGLEVPYRCAGEPRRYRPDFVVLVDDGRGNRDLLRLVVEIKGYRGEDAKEKKATMDTYWVPAVNHLKTMGRWAFAEFTDVYEVERGFAAVVERAVDAAPAAVGARA
jgi:type III restriction enzyme